MMVVTKSVLGCSSVLRRSGLQRSGLTCSVAAAMAAALVLSAEGEAAAQTAAPLAINPEGKGIVGGALLGGEVVITIMGAAGLRDWWPYLVFGGLGSVGGGIGGWALDNEVKSSELSIGLLTGGLVLLIPSVVVMVNALSQSPPEVQKLDSTDPAKKEPAPKPQQPGEPPPKAGRPRLYPGALVGVVGGAAAPGLPAVGVGQLYSQRQMQSFGVGQGVEVRVPVFEARF